MAGRHIQNQISPSLPVFCQQHDPEVPYLAVTFLSRLPTAFLSSAFGNTDGYRVSQGLFLCHCCCHQASLTNVPCSNDTLLPVSAGFSDITLLNECQPSVTALQNVQFQHASCCTHTEISRDARQAVELGNLISSIGPQFIRGFYTSACGHERYIKRAEHVRMMYPDFNWGVTRLGNIKCSIIEIYHVICGVHFPYYLVIFECRLTRHHDVKAIFSRWMTVAVQVLSILYRLPKLAESYA